MVRHGWAVALTEAYLPTAAGSLATWVRSEHASAWPAWQRRRKTSNADSSRTRCGKACVNSSAGGLACRPPPRPLAPLLPLAHLPSRLRPSSPPARKRAALREPRLRLLGNRADDSCRLWFSGLSFSVCTCLPPPEAFRAESQRRRCLMRWVQSGWRLALEC